MKFWLIAAAAAAVTVPGAPPLPPHLHYEIRIISIPKHLSPAERLTRACDLTKDVSERMRGQNDAILDIDLSKLRLLSCGTQKSK